MLETQLGLPKGSSVPPPGSLVTRAFLASVYEVKFSHLPSSDYNPWEQIFLKKTTWLSMWSESRQWLVGLVDHESA